MLRLLLLFSACDLKAHPDAAEGHEVIAVADLENAQM